ncbi:hypothetical protein I350_04753 [Cryptococcus amylolentus CBS 6273]|uniref:Uncharacterized protein n=1 Tax=Cryptococcus amylolentus CBS 6273 TaxID=1296118 RepID=A0A1E3JY12_9TREE|nr:hypothetical protein I350_04753 [Cryptococcus amylolentus CBS 6273]
MAFIGSGEFEHKIAHLQRQLSHKDHELRSITNEQLKREEELAEVRKAKETAEEKLREEADRALKAKNELESNKKEILQLKLHLSNLETSFKTTSEKLKKEEKEREKVQDALDDALSRGSDGTADQIRSQQLRIKQLEDDVKKSEQEAERLRAQGSSGGSNGSDEPLNNRERFRLMSLQNENAELKTQLENMSSAIPSTSQSSTPSFPVKQKSRRSLSVSACDMRDLEGQVETLTTQLANTKRDHNKAVNEKLALEHATKNKVASLEEDLEEARGELEFYHASDGGIDAKQVEELKKAAQQVREEKEDLARKLSLKEEEVKRQLGEITRLEGEAHLLESLRAELDDERQARQELEAANTDQAGSETNSSLEKISALEAELAKVKAATNTTSRSGDSELRQVRRDLQKALRDRDYLDSLVKENDELLAEKDEEISRMRAAIPIPGSPVLGAQGDSSRVADLEEEKAGLLIDLEKQVEDHAHEIAAIETKLSATMSELDHVKAAETEARQKFEEGQTKIHELQDGHQEVSMALEQARAHLASRETEAKQLTQQLTETHSALGEKQAALASAEQEAQDILDRLSKAQAALAEKQKDFDQAQRQRDDLQTVLDSRSYDDAEYEALRVSFKQAQDALEEVTHGLETADSENKELNDRVAESQEAQEAAEAELLVLIFQARHKLTCVFRSLEIKLVELNDEIASIKNQPQETVAQLESSKADSHQTVSELGQASRKNHELEIRISELDAKLREISQGATLSTAKVDESNIRHEASLAAAEARAIELDHPVKELQSSLRTDSETSPQNSVNLAHTKEIEEKLGRLRAERDNLRHNLSFVKNESHFAVRAANSERDEVLEEVQRLKDDLRRSQVTCEKLEKEIGELRIAAQDKQTELDGASSTFANDKKHLDEHIVNLKNSLAAAQADAAVLNSRVAELESNLQTREDVLKHTEAKAESLQTELTNVLHHVAQSRKLSDRPESRASSTVASEDGDLPGDLASAVPTESRRLSHQRSRSGVLPNVLTERTLQDKIERRDVRITKLTNDLQKAKSNLALLESAQEETIAENAELEEECGALHKQLDTEAQSSAEDARGLVLALATYRQQLHGAELRWSVAQDVLAKAREAAQVLRSTAAADRKASSEQEARIMALEATHAVTSTALATAKSEQESARAELESSREANKHLQTRIAESEQAGVVATDSADRLANLESRLLEKEERLRDLSTRNDDLTAKLEHMLKTEKEALSRAAGKEEEISALTVRIEELSLGVADAQSAAASIESEKDRLLEELAEAEMASSESLANIETQKSIAQDKASKAEEELAKVNQQLDQRNRELALAIANSETLSAELQAEKSRSAEITVNIDQQQSTVDQLRARISSASEAFKIVEAERDALRTQMGELQAQVSEDEGTAQAAARAEERLAVEAESARRNIKELTELLEKAVAEKEELSQQSKSVDQIREAAQKELAESRSEITRLSAERHVSEDKLDNVRGRLDEALQRTKALEASIASLKDENEKLKGDLAQAMTVSSTPVVDEQLVIELRERIDDLEAALTQKNKEVDEADDQTREAFKAKAKLERKIGKLTRQLEQAQTDVNTAMNKLLSSKPIAPSPAKRASGPVPVPSRTSMPPAPTTAQAAPAPVSRTPRAIPPNIFSPPTAPGSGHKRSRENDDAEAMRPVEAIMLPASSNIISPRKALGSKSSFTPQRGGAFAPLSTRLGVNGNVTAEKPVIGEMKKSVDMGRNIFAKPSPMTTEPAKRSAFPLPPSRTPFGTTGRHAS